MRFFVKSQRIYHLRSKIQPYASNLGQFNEKRAFNWQKFGMQYVKINHLLKNWFLVVFQNQEIHHLKNMIKKSFEFPLEIPC